MSPRFVLAVLASLAAGSIVAPSVAAAEAPLGIWRAVDIDGAKTARGVASTLELRGDGKVSGEGGCNRFAGKAVIGPGSLVLGPLMSTRMACPGERSVQEGHYLAALERARGWRLDGRVLILLDAGGTVVARLRPAR